MRSPLALLASVLLLAGCVTAVQNRENLLTASGFKARAATSPEQIAMLGNLPTNKISPVKHGAHVLFVYPDPKKSVLYVGTATEYAAYKKARDEQKLATDEQTATFQQQAKMADLDGWKGLSDGWYNF